MRGDSEETSLIAVERHGLSDFLMDKGEAGLLFLKKEN